MERNSHTIPSQIRWYPFDLNPSATFVTGLKLLAGAGDIQTKNGLGMYIYSWGTSMKGTEVFYSIRLVALGLRESTQRFRASAR
jgi:homogentisate 1,2-dioxygenase